MSHGTSPRFDVIFDLKNRVPRHVEVPRDEQGRKLKISEYFGINTFGLTQMRDKLPSDVYAKLRSTLEHGKGLDKDIANVVAHAIKEWALSRGVTHFCHWFQPQTGSTAEKHDAFLTIDDNKMPIEKFSGAQLIQSEPDASSFPSGGMRTTFEARGYTAWDPSSPVFIMEAGGISTLCVPSVFISYHGDALDEKTALVRSVEILSTRATELLHLIGHTGAKRVIPTLGAEQEYFLIDRAFYMLRPDLVMAGRTLVGGQPPKGQQLEDHYFGSIPARVLAFMAEMEHELFKLGVPVKTRHNEVAPGQYEVAPDYEQANLATDHQQLVMSTMRRVAERHGMVCVLHEKPFAGVNGSGKHVNWSFGNSTQGNLLEPGQTPHENAQFLVFCAAAIRAVHKYGGVLRSAIASAANDHRLGANEAPPAIISVFLGEQLNDVFEQIRAGGAKSSKTKGHLEVGVDTLPKLPMDAGDRNRTSPFAFTGNKFEFRAVGSNMSIAGPLIALNTAVSEALDYIATKLEGAVGEGKPLNTAIQSLLTEIIKEHGAVVFNGDGYSAEWHAEAEKRGLLNLKTTPEALKVLEMPETVKLFDKYKVLSPRELHSRYEIYCEQYVKTILVEAKLTAKMATTVILPAAVKYATELAKSPLGSQLKVTDKISKLALELEKATEALESALAHEGAHGAAAEAEYLCKTVVPAMLKVRQPADALEGLVSDEDWPLPTYQEMLFLR